ncbi:hypothetical protein R3P38DRAFT_2625896 [Favolaschia claudopus]|uniref:Uncharacterized protein n=1 Tax=Favolaschia claudopus TaxID=2862362 RepID=A0AAW0BJ07_9AGAR
MGINRKDLISAYRDYVSTRNEPENFHPALFPKGSPDPLFSGSWKLIGADAKKCFAEDDDSANNNDSKKRKGEKPSDRDATKKRKLAPTKTPVGLKWDAVDYSCAYDAVFSCLYMIWVDDTVKWSNRFREISYYCRLLAQGFENVSKRTSSLENARDHVRHVLTKNNPTGFPTGWTYTYLSNLTSALFEGQYWGVDTTKCIKCDSVYSKAPGFPNSMVVYEIEGPSSSICTSPSQWLNEHRISATDKSCPMCGSRLTCFSVPTRAPPILHFDLCTDTTIDTSVNITVDNERVEYALRGVIYSGTNHFTARMIDNGYVWYHDGMETGRACILEGLLDSKSHDFLNECHQGGVARNAVSLLYAVVKL